MSPEMRQKHTAKMDKMTDEQKEHVQAMGRLIRRLEADIQLFYDVKGRDLEFISGYCSTCIDNIKTLTDECAKDEHVADFTDVTVTLTRIVSEISPGSHGETGSTPTERQRTRTSNLADLKSLAEAGHPDVRSMDFGADRQRRIDGFKTWDVDRFERHLLKLYYLEMDSFKDIFEENFDDNATWQKEVSLNGHRLCVVSHKKGDTQFHDEVKWHTLTVTWPDHRQEQWSLYFFMHNDKVVMLDGKKHVLDFFYKKNLG